MGACGRLVGGGLTGAGLMASVGRRPFAQPHPRGVQMPWDSHGVGRAYALSPKVPLVRPGWWVDLVRFGLV